MPALTQPVYLLLVISIYLGFLFAISFFTGKDDSNSVFFKANRHSPWLAVAFGMIGASLSGVTFLSVPGWVQSTRFGYMQVVFGYMLGYLVIAFVLIPLYYRLNIISIYSYLGQRFGTMSHKTGAFFFLISRIIIASFRLFLVASVLQYFIFDHWRVPFFITVSLSVLLIWAYTFRGGIKTIVWTDVLQTFFMLFSVVFTIVILLQQLDTSFNGFIRSDAFKQYSQIIFTDDINAKLYWLKSVLGGMFIAIAMTGLDQDNMQKNLTCKNTRESQKNVISLGVVLIIVNFIFLFLGVVLFVYAGQKGISVPEVNGRTQTDLLFPEIALNSGLGIPLATLFILGLIAATYSSADSALTALTTSVSVDFLNLNKYSKKRRKSIRKTIHFALSILLILVVISFKYLLTTNVIDSLLQASTYTYGPLLGLFAFGLFTRYRIKDHLVFGVAILAVILTFVLNKNAADWFNGYRFGYEILIINGLLTFIGLWIIRTKKTAKKQ